MCTGCLYASVWVLLFQGPPGEKGSQEQVSGAEKPVTKNQESGLPSTDSVF